MKAGFQNPLRGPHKTPEFCLKHLVQASNVWSLCIILSFIMIWFIRRNCQNFSLFVFRSTEPFRICRSSQQVCLCLIFQPLLVKLLNHGVEKSVNLSPIDQDYLLREGGGSEILLNRIQLSLQGWSYTYDYTYVSMLLFGNFGHNLNYTYDYTYISILPYGDFGHNWNLMEITLKVHDIIVLFHW